MGLTKNKKAVFGLILVVCLVSLAIIYLNTGNSEEDGGKIIYFYGFNCPHCKNVEAYMEENNMTSKLQIEEHEVMQDKKNLAKMVRYARGCGFTGNSLQTPFVYSGGSCYMGEDDVMNFLKTRATGP